MAPLRVSLIALQVLAVLGEGGNPTHYGDPKTGCESDEKAVQVQGLSGDFCSPQCKSGACPSDVPSGDTAKPQCALKTSSGDQYCALICSPSALRLNGADGECGTGACQSIQGVGLCTYATAGLNLETLVAKPLLKLEANPTHYGDPKTGCESDEKAVQVQGLSGDFCSPQCKAGACPSDEPSGATAKPQCALKTSSGDQYCALICSPSALRLNGANGECGTGACQSIQGVGLCTYATAGLNLETLVAKPLLKLEANPTHYGDPKTGCESDEKAVQVQGVSGDFCSPVCKSGSCPSDVPSGDTAKPQCALKTSSGDQYCALICSPSAESKNGANGECGTGACQSIQGTGLCTYATAQGNNLSTLLALSRPESVLVV